MKNTKKRILTGLGVLAISLAMLPLFAAFEAHVINVTATIENATALQTDDIAFGTVFPEEELENVATLALSSSFLAQDRVDRVDYHIRQKPKCWNNSTSTPEFGPVTDTENGFACEDNGFQTLPILCPFLSKHPDDTPLTNDGSLDAYHGPTSTVAWTPSVAAEFEVNGVLDKAENDLSDDWTIDLNVPCFQGNCAQDNVVPEAYQLDPTLEHSLFGCDLWFEVTDIGETQD